jgi:hypothetical protein
MAYDAAAQHVLLFGGDDWSALGEYGDTWTLAGNVWSQDLSTPAPAMRRDHRMTYDAARQRVVLLGGWSYVGTSSVYYGDTWEHDGSGWTEAQPTQSPPGRYLHGQAYDPVRQRTVVFSGSGSWYTRTRSDVWEYDGVTWMQVLESSRTGGRTPAYLTYCGRPGNVMMLGTGVAAMLDDVWRYWPTSLHPDEQCGSGADDDGDGLTDCADPDCTGMPCGSGLTCSAGMCQ